MYECAMQTVSFLRFGGTLADLETRYAIKHKRGSAHPNLVLLKYSQIDSPMAEPIVQECRGLILDETDKWRVVSRSFDKFFNHGEGHAAPIDWQTAEVQEKLDGSLCVLYHYMGAWHVQTSGTPDASGKVGDTSMLFSDLFWHVFDLYGYSKPGPEFTDICFAFELCTKWNRIIVCHEKERLVFLAARNRVTGAPCPMTGEIFSFEKVRSFPLQSFEDIAATFATMEPLKQEGYVVVDAYGNRVKVKHPGYVAIHHLKEGHSTRRLLEIVQAGEVGEFITYFPEWASEFKNIQDRLNELICDLESDYERLCDIPIQKDFALKATKTRCAAALFAVRAKKSHSIKEYLCNVQPEGLMKTLGLKDE